MSILIAIADAVVESLNAATLSQVLTSERHYQPVFDLPEMTDLHVSVVPKGIEVLASSRNQNQHDYAIDIGIQQKVADDAQADVLMSLAEEIADHFRRGRVQVEAIGNIPVLKVSTEPVFAPEHLTEKRVFTSIITLTFRVLR
jgi:hypothetical protein